MEETILQSVKGRLGIVSDYDVFDDQVLMDINTAFSVLHQLGVGPKEGYDITASTTWSEVITEPRLNMIKNYVYVKVKVLFNPPSVSFVLNNLTEELREMEWRIRSEVECYGQ